MRSYNLSWSWYDDYSSIWLRHREDRTEEQFKKDCQFALKIELTEYLKQEDSWVSLPNIMEFSVRRLELIGYEIVKPITYSLWGMAYIISGTEKTEEKTALLEIFGEEGLSKIIAHNKKVDENLYKEKSQ